MEDVRIINDVRFIETPKEVHKMPLLRTNYIKNDD